MIFGLNTRSMKAIIILGLSTMAQAVFSQQQQMQQRNVIIVNNVSNINVFNSQAVLSNIQVNLTNNEQKQQVVRSVARANPVRRTTQVRSTNVAARSAPQVRRRSRPRTVNITPAVVVQPQVLNTINTPEANQMLNASAINVPAQNLASGNGFDIQIQNVSKVANEDGNPFSPNESNTAKESLQINTSIDLSINLKGKTITRTRSSSSSSSSGSSSHSRSHTFNKKMAKFKRNFFGKLSSHKKGNHRLDMCFNWK